MLWAKYEQDMCCEDSQKDINKRNDDKRLCMHNQLVERGTSTQLLIIYNLYI